MDLMESLKARLLHSPQPALERILRHDRMLVIAAIAAVTILAWAHIISLAGSASAASSMEELPGMDMARPSFSRWNASQFILMFAMWSVMMIGMMLPSVTPMLLIYARVARQAFEQGSPLASTAWFVGGYIAAWLGFALIVTVGQWALESSLLLTSMGKVSDAFGGAILIAAGLYQWLPLKGYCLSQCQSPLLFIQRSGGLQSTARASTILGIRHGFYCVGCCWTLMLLLFVAGVMNLLWIAGLAVIVLLEKLIPLQPWSSRAIGAGLILSGAALSSGILNP